jgi:hypothetical protein
MNKQRGVTLTGLLVTSVLLVFVAIVGFKLLPSYIEYWTVQRIISDIARAPDVRGGSLRDVQAAFDRRTAIDNVNSVKSSDLEVTKTSDGFDILVSWTTRVPLFGNVNACIDFQARN